MLLRTEGEYLIIYTPKGCIDIDTERGMIFIGTKAEKYEVYPWDWVKDYVMTQIAKEVAEAL